MSPRRSFWLQVLIAINTALLFAWLTVTFVPILGRPDRFSPGVGFKEISDLNHDARRNGKPLTVAEVEAKIAELKQSPITNFDYQVIGLDSNWTVFFIQFPRRRSWLDRLVGYVPEQRPAYVMSSATEGITVIRTNGQPFHEDFSW
jgi:hypothetical protein